MLHKLEVGPYRVITGLFVLVFCSQGLGAQVATAQSGAVKWLERNMKLLDDHGDPFEVAIVAYALLLSKASTAEAAFGILAKHARREGNWPFLRVCTVIPRLTSDPANEFFS